MAAQCFLLFMLMAFFAASSAVPFNGDLRIPDECEDESFCAIKPVAYDDLVKHMYEALPKHLKEFGQKSGGLGAQTKTLSHKNDWHNCPYITETGQRYAYVYNKTEGKVDYLVQTDIFSQEFETVKCAYEHIPKSDRGIQECFQDLQLNDVYIKSTCNNIYTNASLYYYDIQTETIKGKAYQVPVCCTCDLQPMFAEQFEY